MPSPASRFELLTALLADWYPVWSVEPFQHLALPWASHQPQLARDLRKAEGHDAGSDGETHAGSALAALAGWLPVRQLAALVNLPRLPAVSEPPADRWAAHVGGRKWRQIAAFASRVSIAPGESLLEWCAGKGHLARALAHSRRVPVTGLESDPRLCREGRALAVQQGAPVRLPVQDVLAEDVFRWLHPRAHVVALHACGDLHRHLLDLAVQTGCTVTLAPCCYQRMAHERYRPLSETGRQLTEHHTLELTRGDLALAVQETVTAPGHARRQRRKAKAWRLGFDLLQRELRGVNAYLPVPRLRYGDLPADFEGFCRWAAREKQLSVAVGIDWHGLERAGWRRLDEVERLERIRHLFRRPLEVWLALDRAQRLREAGFRVALGTFCPREITPRNLLLCASRK